ncbi:MAG: hypothetical protein WB783_10450 [Arenicellales bacterium]
MARDLKTTQLQIRLSPREKTRIARAAKCAGLDVSAYVLGRLREPAAERFQALVSELATAPDPTFVLATLNDFLETLAPEDFQAACAQSPAHSLNPLAANYLAAMVETAAHRKRRRPPSWTARIEPLDEPWFASGLRSLRLWLLVVSPPPFKRRNLFIDAGLGDRV